MAVSAHSDAAPFTLVNGPGDGTLSVGVDGYGAFGSSVGPDSANAFYNPVGGGASAGTSFESGVAIRFGASGTRAFLTSGDIGGSGSLSSSAVSGGALSGSSSFSLGGLNFSVTQTLVSLFDTNSVQIGTRLEQTYVIANGGASNVSFELIRYLDGDLGFDGSLIDGGGRLFVGSTEILFETDSATGSADPTTFVGITAEGGTIPAAGRYEIDSYSGLRTRIVSGTALDDTVAGDSGDADQFIDAGNGYDVTLALRNLFDIPAGGSATYTTTTIFGSGAPTNAIPANRPPVAVCTNVVVAANANCQANASVDGGSFDLDGDPLTITQTPAGPYPLGTTPVTLTVSDGKTNSSCNATVTVVDTTPPTIQCPGATLVWQLRSNFFDPRGAGGSGSGIEGACASLINGRIYVSHGYREGDSALLSTYDIATDTWVHGGVSAPDATVVRSEMAGGTAFGKHYAIGGRSGPVATVEEFDPVAATWTTKAPMSIARGGLGAASYGNKIYAIGGRDGSQFGFGTIFGLNEVYDPVANTWTALAPLPVAVAENYATVALNGKVYVFGGATGPATAVNLTQIYDIASDTWSFGAPMPTARGDAMAGVIGGKIAVFGGYDTTNNLATTELYDPVANTWSAGPNMVQAASEIAQGVTYDSTGIYAIGSGIFGLSDEVVQVLTSIGGGNLTTSTDPGQCSAIVTYDVTASDNCGPVSLVCVPPSGSVFPKGTTTVTCTATDAAGNSNTCSFTVTVIDNEAPLVACREASNPSGKKIPVAGKNPKSGQNPDGFYQLLAKDNCDPVPAIFIRDSASSFVAGPFVSGDIVKITQVPGGVPGQQPMSGVVVGHVFLNGDALVFAVDADGNVGTTVGCRVPPLPK